MTTVESRFLLQSTLTTRNFSIQQVELVTCVSNRGISNRAIFPALDETHSGIAEPNSELERTDCAFQNLRQFGNPIISFVIACRYTHIL
jgi:hypothetical protein